MSISELAGNVSGSCKGTLEHFCQNKLQPNQASKLTAGSLGGCSRPPDEIWESEVPGKLGN